MSKGDGPDGGLLLSLDNVAVRLPIARAGSRCLAAMLDYFLWSLVMLLLALVFIGGLLLVGGGITGGWLAALYLLVTLVVDLGFFAGQEILMGGQTIGKRVARLRVVSRRGAKAGPLSLVLRNLVRTLDLLVGVPLMLLDPSARRVGDRLAGTRVVHTERGLGEASAATLVRRAPRGWSSTRILVVERLLERLPTLDPRRSAELSSRVLEAAERDDPTFLERVPPALDPSTRLIIAFAGELPEPA